MAGCIELGLASGVCVVQLLQSLLKFGNLVPNELRGFVVDRDHRNP